ncbi:MAG: chorismate-binding protein, partial [Parabacteroides sp.]|nr:chorismate-binding protein [Parabacteroides sp.]
TEQKFPAHELGIPYATDNKADYTHRFQLFIDPLEKKEFDKLVLSRHQVIQRDADLSPATVFYKACERYQYSYIYLCHTPETGTWLGCTPEIILSGEKGAWHTVALAGTQPLLNGTLPTEWDQKTEKSRNM